ncbi:MAG: DUF5979 domain-containing protein, partial [Acidimicrobiia bacterium]
MSGLLLVSLAGPASAAPLPSDVRLEQWSLSGVDSWTTGNLGSGYAEGDTVPFRLDVTAAGNGTFEFTVCRDFQDGTSFGYLFLDPFNTTVSPDLEGATITDSLGDFTGAGTGATVDVVSVVDNNVQNGCMPGERATDVQITISGLAGTDEAFVLWGGHLASPLDPGVGAGNGASSFQGSSLHMSLLSPSKDLAANANQITPTPTGSLTIDKIQVGGTPNTTFFVDIDCTVDTFDALDQPITDATSIVINNIPVGTVCTVTEDANPLFSTIVSGSPATIDVDGETVTITNTRLTG